MLKKLNKVAEETNNFLSRYLYLQKQTDLILPMKYGLFPGGKKIRSKIIFDVGKIFNIKKGILMHLCGAVECIHAYSLIHDDLPCMDDDDLRRGKLSTHKKFGEATAVLAGNSLLTLAFEILSKKNFNIKNKTKTELMNLISKCSGHEGMAGGQFSDLNFERKKIALSKITEMQIKKTGKLFSFCCIAPILIAQKYKFVKKFEIIGLEIGFLFQIVDDLIDFRGISKNAGKKTKKDYKKGKATLISLLGHKNTIKYEEKLKKKILYKLKNFGKKADDLRDTINFIVKRNK